MTKNAQIVSLMNQLLEQITRNGGEVQEVYVNRDSINDQLAGVVRVYLTGEGHVEPHVTWVFNGLGQTFSGHYFTQAIDAHVDYTTRVERVLHVAVGKPYSEVQAEQAQAQAKSRYPVGAHMLDRGTPVKIVGPVHRITGGDVVQVEVLEGRLKGYSYQAVVSNLINPVPPVTVSQGR